MLPLAIMFLMTGLLGSPVLEVALGVACVYLLLGLFCMTVGEAVASFLALRAKLLHEGIERLLQSGEENLGPFPATQMFHEHPLIRTAMKGHPSYLPAHIFSQAVLDLVTPNKQPGGGITYFDVYSGAQTLPPALRAALTSLIQTGGNTLEDVQWAIERWYDDAMDRVTGLYKRKIQLLIVVFAAMATVAINADTLHIARVLWNAPARGQTAPIVSNAVSARPGLSVNYPDPNQPSDPQVTGPVNSPSSADPAPASGAVGPMLGWGVGFTGRVVDLMERIMGWLLTIMGASVAAPLWFDLLNRFTNLRYTGPVSRSANIRPESQPKNLSHGA